MPRYTFIAILVTAVNGYLDAGDMMSLQECYALFREQNAIGFQIDGDILFFHEKEYLVEIRMQKRFPTGQCRFIHAHFTGLTNDINPLRAV